MHVDERPQAAGSVRPGAPTSPHADAFAGRPPIPLVCVASMALVLLSGIYLAAYLPRRAPLGPAVGLVAVAGAVLVLAVVLVAGLRQFAWDAFFGVVKWALVAYAVIAGILEFVFVYDGTRGTMLILLTASLFVFAVDIPVLLGFSVARFQVPRARS
ncbi:MAG TPA: hypothetical protein VND62_03665 [Acidimicrobiales bacterium]|nr:hypothetical protein [Acidimicrobiales bacterium]